jgi:hypothetical protein
VLAHQEGGGHGRTEQFLLWWPVSREKGVQEGTKERYRPQDIPPVVHFLSLSSTSYILPSPNNAFIFRLTFCLIMSGMVPWMQCWLSLYPVVFAQVFIVTSQIRYVCSWLENQNPWWWVTISNLGQCSAHLLQCELCSLFLLKRFSFTPLWRLFCLFQDLFSRSFTGEFPKIPEVQRLCLVVSLILSWVDVNPMSTFILQGSLFLLHHRLHVMILHHYCTDSV